MMAHSGMNKSIGFTLIEVLVALAIFALGMLGLGLQMSKNLNATINKEVHSSVMQLALQSVEPLNQAVLIKKENFLSALNNLNTFGQAPVFDTNNSQHNEFKISIASAIDSNGNALLATDIDTWLPPFTVVLNIEYVKDTDNSLNFKSTHVFVPPRESI